MCENPCNRTGVFSVPLSVKLLIYIVFGILLLGTIHILLLYIPGVIRRASDGFQAAQVNLAPRKRVAPNPDQAKRLGSNRPLRIRDQHTAFVHGFAHAVAGDAQNIFVAGEKPGSPQVVAFEVRSYDSLHRQHRFVGQRGAHTF